jgi:hypothetical protein
MEYIILAIVAFIVGWKISAWVSASAFRDILDELGVSNKDLTKMIKEKYGQEVEVEEADEAEETPTLTPLEISIEEHQGVLFAYRLADGLFLGQGRDREALIESLTNNLSNVRVTVDKEHGADYLIKP